jgi:hypothetical protein
MQVLELRFYVSEFCDYINVQKGMNGSMCMYCVRHSRARLPQLTVARLFSSRCRFLYAITTRAVV